MSLAILTSIISLELSVSTAGFLGYSSAVLLSMKYYRLRIGALSLAILLLTSALRLGALSPSSSSEEICRLLSLALSLVSSMMRGRRLLEVLTSLALSGLETIFDWII